MSARLDLYTRDEDMLIINAVISMKGYNRVKSRCFWKEVKNQMPSIKRSAEGMRYRFMNHIGKNISLYPIEEHQRDMLFKGSQTRNEALSVKRKLPVKSEPVSFDPDFDTPPELPRSIFLQQSMKVEDAGRTTSDLGVPESGRETDGDLHRRLDKLEETLNAFMEGQQLLVQQLQERVSAMESKFQRFCDIISENVCAKL